MDFALIAAWIGIFLLWMFAIGIAVATILTGVLCYLSIKELITNKRIGKDDDGEAVVLSSGIFVICAVLTCCFVAGCVRLTGNML
mgnify:CR=1 FL=1